MSNAWETTDEDVFIVLQAHGLVDSIDDPKVNDALGKIDKDKVKESALYGKDLDEQTDCAQEEIEAQLKAYGFIPHSAKAKFYIR